jgi:hypothetical protein
VLTALEPEPDRRKRTIAVVGALAVTAGIALLALYIGHLAYEGRKNAMHQRRLERVLSAKPHVSQVVAGLADEKAEPLATARTPAELEAAAERWGGSRRAEILAEGARATSTRVFAAGDVRYFLYFDARGVMTGFTLAVD